MNWNKLEQWSNRDKETGAFLSLPPGLGSGSPGVMLVEPVGRLAMCDDIVVCDVLHNTKWREDQTYDRGDRILIHLDVPELVEFGSGILADYAVISEKSGCEIIGKFELEDHGDVIDVEFESSQQNDPTEPKNGTEQRVRARSPKRGETAVLLRPGGVSRWVEFMCGHCDHETIISSGAVGEQLKHKKVGWNKWSLNVTVSCPECNTTWTEADEKFEEENQERL